MTTLDHPPRVPPGRRRRRRRWPRSRPSTPPASDVAPGRPGRLRRPRHRRGRAGARRPTRTSSSSPWPTPSRTASRRAWPSSQADEKVAAKVDVPPERRFVGFDAYKKVIASGVDVVLLCTPPHFRPLHLRGGGRGRQARLRREAGRRRRPRRPLACWRPATRRRRRTCRSSPACACATTTASARRSGGSTTAPIGEVVTLQANDYRGGRLGQAAAAGLDRHDLPDAQLVLLHLALGRLQRRAARPLPRRLRLGDEGPSTPSGPSAWAAGRCAPGRSTATSTTTSRSSTSTPTGPGSSATAGSSRAARTT